MGWHSDRGLNQDDECKHRGLKFQKEPTLSDTHRIQCSVLLQPIGLEGGHSENLFSFSLLGFLEPFMKISW